ncbi:CUB and sushi domain-containing protein 3-like isoform X1 [Daphnia pulicaria]|uniref:CUB and sushi domain-containing protein 3-like isoform X1 n=1 Tax=Daphnia pulicaria TaxID=35523 RepID=UPI001EEC96D2|nr:CUB and sushi domain-containing protein 3-like isoform X1 [Daphnia pulicaria]
MTSLNLQILQDGSADVERSNSTVRIPRSCLKQDANEENTFSVVLPFNSQTCPIEWKPLDRCRKYTFDMSSQYTETWNGPMISANVFTRGNEANFSFESNSYNSWLCPKKHFICNHGCASSEHGRIAAYVCNGENNCIAGRDENYCDQNICKDGFKCGRQCIPKELVCNGQHDCVNGSDEEYSSCTYSNVCQHFTNSSGSFSSITFPKPANEIHSERDFDAARKNSVLISVQPNHKIWLAFEKCVTFENQHFVNIYDGPYSTSPLLLSYSGSVKPFSVRSSSNDLYVEFPSYYYPNYGITAFYTSMKSTNESFVPDCGGYINGEGIISTPNYLLNTNISDCYWFIDARQNEDTILLTMSNSALLSSSQELGAASRSELSSDDDYANNYYDHQITTTSSTTMLPPRNDPPPSILVYDGWSSSGTVLYDSETFNEQRGKNIYSISNKMMVRSKAPVVRSNFVSSLKVSKISTPQCNHKFEEPNGIIKSPNYPLLYPNVTDCRWSIEVDPSSKVRLLFAFFETQEGADFLYVYDGPTVYSNLLFEKSGSVKTPFQVDSTTNKILIRFTSDGEISFPGFFNVYSSV